MAGLVPTANFTFGV